MSSFIGCRINSFLIEIIQRTYTAQLWPAEVTDARPSLENENLASHSRFSSNPKEHVLGPQNSTASITS